MEILRTDYLDILSSVRDMNSTVKILVGMRRSGKSTVMNQFIEVLRNSGVQDEMICHLDLDLLDGVVSTDDLKALLDPVLGREGQHYILIDEVQNVEGWERVTAMLVARKDCDVYLTGSSSKMLSSELSTKMSGRYVEIKILPFSFREYLEMHPGDEERRFDEYLRLGSLPVIDPDADPVASDGIIEGVYNTVMVRDVLEYVKGDVRKLRAICRFLYTNIGNVTNIDAISKGASVANETTGRYMDALESAFLFQYAERYDIVGKKVFDSNGKYYATDLGMRRVILRGIDATDISKPIENLVFFELRRRGYTVRIGSFKGKEIDFTVFKGDEVEYYQVTQTMLSEDTRTREFSPLEGLKDNYPKTILTLDRIGLGNHEGIRVVNLIDWLLGRTHPFI